METAKAVKPIIHLFEGIAINNIVKKVTKYKMVVPRSGSLKTNNKIGHAAPSSAKNNVAGCLSNRAATLAKVRMKNPLSTSVG